MTKRIIKNITLCVLLIMFVCISCIGFSGCYNGPFFDKEHLSSHLVPDLPQPKKSMQSYRGNQIKVEMTKEQFDQYVVTVYEYLLSCNFEKLGTQGELAPYLVGVKYYVNLDVSELSDFYILQEMADKNNNYYKYVFVWANVYSETDNDWISHYLELRYEDNVGKMFMELCYALAPYVFEKE